jgi:AraC-like DNA-binding protein
VRVSDVAAHVALSCSRLSHVFKQHTRRGINEYLHEYRIARACAALMESRLSVGEIAADVGYSDARFFHRVFRRHTGCNPTQYRQHCAATRAAVPPFS